MHVLPYVLVSSYFAPSVVTTPSIVTTPPNARINAEQNNVWERGYELLTKNKPFHTDTVCDCLCLVTKNCAAKGGHSILASGWAVYNEIAATRPDIIQELAKPNWPFDT